MRISDWSSDVCSSDLLAYALNKMACAAIAQIVAVDRRNHHIRQLHRSNTARQIHRLVDIQRIGPSMAHIAERTATRALIAHNHERRSEEHTSELQSLMRISYAVFCLKKKKKHTYNT